MSSPGGPVHVHEDDRRAVDVLPLPHGASAETLARLDPPARYRALGGGAGVRPLAIALDDLATAGLGPGAEVTTGAPGVVEPLRDALGFRPAGGGTAVAETDGEGRVTHLWVSDEGPGVLAALGRLARRWPLVLVDWRGDGTVREVGAAPTRTGSVAFARIDPGRYDATRGGEGRGARYAARIAPHLPAAGPVLEVGVGTGLVAAALAARGHVVVGVDLAPSMLALAVPRLGPRVAVADAALLPAPDGRLSGWVACHVLHLVADRGAVLAEAARALREGGRAVAVVVGPDPSAASDVDEVEMAARAAVAPRRDAPADLSALAAPLGLAAVAADEERREEGGRSPAETAAGIEGRLWSYTWDLPADCWARHLEPAVEALRALPDQHRPRRRVTVETVLVLERQ